MKRALIALALTACSRVLPVTTPAHVDGAGSDGDVVVPDLIGKTREEAAALVAAAGFTGPVESSRPVECEDAPRIEGLINCQVPAPGAAVRPYTTVQINVYQPTRIAGAVVRDQLSALIGMTPGDARAALASYGHDGLISVEMTFEYDADCGEDRVCGFDVPESGMGVHDSITLYINPPEE